MIRELCAHTHLGLEVESPTLKSHLGLGIFPNEIPRKHTLEFPSCTCDSGLPVRRVEFQASRFLDNGGVGIVELCGSRLTPACLMAIPSKVGDIFS